MDIQRQDLKEKAKRRRLVYGASAGVAVISLGMVVANLDAAVPSVPRSSLWLDAVQHGELLREVRGPGTLVPREVRWISSETAARVDRIVVRPGAEVAADTVILELSNPEVVERHLSAKSELTAAEADHSSLAMTLESQLLDRRASLAALQAEHEGATLQAQAERDLVEDGIVSRIQARRSELTVEQLRVRIELEGDRIAKFRQTMSAQLAANAARIEQLRHAEELHRRRVEALRVTAGTPGVLQQVPVQEGQQVAAGTNIARIARPDDLMAELRIPEAQVKEVALNQVARVDTRNGIVNGRVVRIDPAVVNGAVLVEVELEGALPPGARPDLTVDGSIEIEHLSDITFVGRPVNTRPNSEVQLFRLDPESAVAHRVPVRLGRASANTVEVTEGLRAGDEVILSDTSQWSRYERIRLN